MASIQKRPNGVYRARYRDETGKEHTRHFKRKTDAQQYLDEVAAAVVTGQYVSPIAGKMTFRQFYEDWAERQIWAPRTRSHMDTVVTGASFANIPLGKIMPRHVEDWVKKMQDAKFAPQTIVNRVGSARTIFRAAVRDRRIHADPSVEVKTPRPPRRENQLEIPSVADVAALLDASRPDMRAYVALCAFAGLRLGEASAVKLADVDFMERRLHVQRQVQYAPGVGSQVQPPKAGSQRYVSLPDALLEMLSIHLQKFGTAEGGWLFFTASGKPLSPSTVDSRWRATVKAAGLKGLHLHGLRHFYASGLIAAGCDVATVQKALGHSTPSVTLDVYTHLWPAAEDRTRKAAASVLAEVLADRADSLRTGTTDTAPDPQ